ncbi:MAG TPA: protein disulfide oxidoreductase [Methyloprofundus sp.]|uniref:protein disulfide oxidoreductase n=1 Tax=Methyloprofundus sp. TaxID=2020875 RepID=UPI00182AB6A2|nr:protein disulfide oxidoreductase [Methyloprofundus sp.]HIG64303.1 protein disulfide oxidoreductase [Methyloprofundus sp.]HIL78806.1 protein disulfide oxidoreductase [Methylococcales bacterium]
MKLIRELLLIVVFIGLLQAFMQRDIGSGAFPQLPAKAISGKNSASLIANKPAIIYFWASWCGICGSIQGTISEVLQDYSGVTVALRSGSHADIASYLQKNNLDWQVINDNDGALAQAFGINTVPAVFIVGPDGAIGFITLGYVTEVGLRLRLWWLGIDN